MGLRVEGFKGLRARGFKGFGVCVQVDGCAVAEALVLLRVAFLAIKSVSAHTLNLQRSGSPVKPSVRSHCEGLSLELTPNSSSILTSS